MRERLKILSQLDQIGTQCEGCTASPYRPGINKRVTWCLANCSIAKEMRKLGAKLDEAALVESADRAVWRKRLPKDHLFKKIEYDTDTSDSAFEKISSASV